MNDKRPKPGTPEFEEWLLKRAKKRAHELYNADIPEELADKVGSGIMTGPVHSDDLKPEKTSAEDIEIDKEIQRSHLKEVPRKKS